MRRSGTVQRVVTQPYPTTTPLKFRTFTEAKRYICVDCRSEFESRGGNCLRCEPCRDAWNRRYHTNARNKQRRKKG